MIFLYNGDYDRKCWRLDMGAYWQVLAPDLERGRPGGIVLFTSEEKAYAWLERAKERGAGDLNATVVQCKATLGEIIEQWRSFIAQAGVVTTLYSVFVIDPRSAMHPAERWDAEAVPFDPVLVPHGIVTLEAQA